MRRLPLLLLLLASLAAGAAPGAGSQETAPPPDEQESGTGSDSALKRPRRSFLVASDPVPAKEARTDHVVREIVLRFAEPIAAATVEVHAGGDLTPVEVGRVRVTGDTAVVETPPLDSGFFMVSWTAREADSGDVHLSRYAFFVAPAACDAVDVDGAWTRVRAPHFPVGPPQITGYAVVFGDSHLVVTNGSAILQTEDGGCTWRERYRLPGTGSTGQPALGSSTITDLLAPGSAGYVVARVVDTAVEGPLLAGGGSQQLLVSIDLGRTFRPGGDGLPPPLADGDGEALRCRPPAGACAVDVGLAPGTGALSLYFLQRLPETRALTLYRSDDLGTTFAPTGAAFEDVTTDEEGSYSVALLGAAAALAATPADPPGVVWVTAGGVLQRSVDGGATFETVPTGTDGSPGLQLTHLASEAAFTFNLDPGDPDFGVHEQPPTLVAVRQEAFGGAADAVLRGFPGGPGFEAIGIGGDVPRHVGSVALGTTRDTMALAVAPGDGDGLYAFDAPSGRFVALEVPGDGAVVDVQVSGACAVLMGNRGDELVRRDGALDAELAEVCSFATPSFPELVIPALSAPAGPSGVPGLTPSEITLDLDLDDDTAVGYRLTRPPDGTPVDVAFLIDTSGSMSGYIDEVAAGFERLTQELVARGVDVHFGLAEYNDWDLRYRRVVDISPPAADFVAQLHNLTTRGGSEPHYTALHQLATGAGLDVPDDAGQDVPPGQQMNWRDGAVRLVVHATDETYGGDPYGPTPAETIAALRDRRIRHIGIDVVTDPLGRNPVVEPGRSAVWSDHALVSRGTATLAVGPVDCDQDGDADLVRGDPLVCSIYDEPDITDALVELILAVREDSGAGLQVVAPPGFHGLVYASGRGSDGVGYPEVDLTEVMDLPFVVTYSCEPAVAGTTGVVELLGLVGGSPIAAATATLRCGPQPDTPTVVQAAPQAPPAAAAVAPAPPAPPAPVAVQAPAQAGAASSATTFSSVPSVTAVQAPAAAVAAAPQTQAQVQTVTIRSDDARTFEFRARSREQPPTTTVTVGAAGMLAAVSALLARRRRPSTVLARARR